MSARLLDVAPRVLADLIVEEAGCSWFPRGASPTTTTADPLAEEDLAVVSRALPQPRSQGSLRDDESGCAVYYRDANGVMQEDLVDRLTVQHVVDTTGCGDSFAASMSLGYLMTQDFVQAARYGHAMGAQRCSGTELAACLPLGGTSQQLDEAYGKVFSVSRLGCSPFRVPRYPQGCHHHDCEDTQLLQQPDVVRWST